MSEDKEGPFSHVRCFKPKDKEEWGEHMQVTGEAGKDLSCTWVPEALLFWVGKKLHK